MKEKLLYSGEGKQWKKLPEWAGFYIDLGYFISNYQNPEKRTTVGLSVPTRAYAALFIALGIIFAKVSRSAEDNGNYFQRLCSLPLNTRLLYKQEGRIYKAIFTGVALLDGEPRVKVQIQKNHERASGGLTHLLSANHVANISIASQSDFDLPNKQAGRKVDSAENFASKLLPRADFIRFSSEITLDCVILGRLNLLRYEVKSAELAVRSETESLTEGTLQDIVRIRKFLGGGKIYNCNALSMDGLKPPAFLREDKCQNVIFDGEAGFLKWRHRFQNLNRIVILDRTDPRYSDAETALMQDYVQYRLSHEPSPLPMKPPKGLDIVIYEEIRN